MSDTQQKQKYLCDNILEQGYDAEQFAEFCQKLMGNIDIQSWTLQQLKQIVTKFLESKDTAHNEHESSFIDYQQQKEQAVGPVVGPSAKTDSPNMKKRKEEEEEREEREREEKAKSKKPEVDVDQMFKDPFAKTKSNAAGHTGWGTTSKVGSGQPSQPTQPSKSTKSDFKFDDLLGPSPTKSGNPNSSSEYQLKAPGQAPAMRPVQPQGKQQLAQSYVKKPDVNMNIFEMNIDDPNPTRPNQLSQSQAQHPFQQSQIRTTSQSMGSSTVSTPQTSASRVQPPPQPSQPRVPIQDFLDIIPCGKSTQRNMLSTPGIEFTITGHQIVNRNFFVPDYVLYHVLTKGINVQVKRKYNHFLRLRNMLVKFYPGHRVSFLEKNPWINDKDTEFIAKQKVMIELFMNDLLMNPEFRNCRIVEEFLTLDYKKLKAKLNQYDKLAKLKALEDLCVLSGELSIAYTENHRSYAENLGTFLYNFTHSMDRYKKLQEQLSHNYNSVIKTNNEITEVLTSLQGHCKTFNASVTFGDCYDFEQTLGSLADFSKQLTQGIKFDLKVLESQFKPLLKFQRDNIYTIKQILDTRNKFSQKFSLIRQRINEPYINDSKLSSFKTGVDQPSKHPLVLKYQTGFYNSQLVSENAKMFKWVSWKLSYKLAWYASLYEHRKVQEANFWSKKKVVQPPT